MSKKRDKITKDSKDKKRCKSRKTDDQKWERPDGYKEYEARRRDEDHTTRLRIKTLATLHEIYSPVTSSEM